MDPTHLQISPDAFASLLRRCGNAKALRQGKRLHALIVQTAQERDRFLGNLLVHMYGKCGAAEDASSVFSQIQERNVFSWTIMIGIFVHNEHDNEAICAFQQMSFEGVAPDKATFVSVLSLCASQAALPEGQRMHARIVGCSFLPDVIVETALVNMYVKCSNLKDAWRLFNNMLERNVVSWNAMIAAYAELGLGKDALRLLIQMQLEGVIPDKVTVVSTLDACANLADLADGRQVHACLVDKEFESDVAVGTALVHMYGKCGSLEEAGNIFHHLIMRDVISWTAIIAAHAQHVHAKDALQLFQQMRIEGVVPNKVTVVSILDACASQAALAEGKWMHSYIASSGFMLDTSVENAVMNMYGKCGSAHDAQRMFDRMAERDVVSWTVMVMVFSQQGQGLDPLQIFKQMLLECVIPDRVTFVTMLDACASQGALFEGKQMHSCMVGSGIELDALVSAALVNMYGTCGQVEEARRFLFEMPKRDVVSWTALIAAYAQHKHSREALQLFEQMEIEGVIPDKASFLSILDACASHAVLYGGKQVHKCITYVGLESDSVLGTALVNTYSKCGSLEDSQRAFDSIVEQSVVSWNVIIGTYAQHGHGKQSLHLFQQMQLQGIKPDEVTFFSILSACSYAGLVDEGQRFFVSMCQDYGITPISDHYNCIIDLLARTGRLEDVEGLISSMPCQANATSWMTLLGACKKHVDVERGARAAQHVFKLDSLEHASPYVLLSNIYAAACMWEDVAKVRRIMNGKY